VKSNSEKSSDDSKVKSGEGNELRDLESRNFKVGFAGFHFRVS
jgi:hypothetical protein